MKTNLVACCVVLSIPLLLSACAVELGDTARPLRETVLVEKEVTRVVVQTVPVEKEVTRVVEKEITRVVPQTVVVEKEVTRLVQQTVVIEKIVTPTPLAVTAQPTMQPATHTPAPQPTSSNRILTVNSWRFEITEIHFCPGTDDSRRWLFLLGNATNEGMKTDGWSGLHTINLRDSRGRVYEGSSSGKHLARDKYAADYCVSVNPEQTRRRIVVAAFNVPASETTFTLIPGSLADSWSGDIIISAK